MPIALGMGAEIKRSGFARGIACTPIYESPQIAGEGKRVNSPAAAAAAEEASTCTSSSSSSIGRNSESFGSDGEDLAGEKEVESPYKGPLGALESLEEALPVR